jgi:hypothetical protein
MNTEKSYSEKTNSITVAVECINHFEGLVPSNRPNDNRMFKGELVLTKPIEGILPQGRMWLTAVQFDQLRTQAKCVTGDELAAMSDSEAFGAGEITLEIHHRIVGKEYARPDGKVFSIQPTEKYPLGTDYVSAELNGRTSKFRLGAIATARISNDIADASKAIRIERGRAEVEDTASRIQKARDAAKQARNAQIAGNDNKPTEEDLLTAEQSALMQVPRPTTKQTARLKVIADRLAELQPEQVESN